MNLPQGRNFIALMIEWSLIICLPLIQLRDNLVKKRWYICDTVVNGFSKQFAVVNNLLVLKDKNVIFKSSTSTGLILCIYIKHSFPSKCKAKYPWSKLFWRKCRMPLKKDEFHFWHHGNVLISSWLNYHHLIKNIYISS